MLTSAQLRAYIKDNSAFNKIFQEQEFTETDLQSAIDWATKDTQAVEPFIESFNPASVPDSIMLDGALGRLFDMASTAELRNQSNLAEQNIPVPVGENGLIYERLAAKYTQRFEMKLNKYKIAVNLVNGMDSISSPYVVTEDSTTIGS
jgi:hypothetical protein